MNRLHPSLPERAENPDPKESLKAKVLPKEKAGGETGTKTLPARKENPRSSSAETPARTETFRPGEKQPRPTPEVRKSLLTQLLRRQTAEAGRARTRTAPRTAAVRTSSCRRRLRQI